MELVWLQSTNNTGGTGRSYDSALFCHADRMVWAQNLTNVYKGREVGDRGMGALEEVFGVRYNDLHSNLRRNDIGVDKPNSCYMMPMYKFLGTTEEFQAKRAALKSISNERTHTGSRHYADLGKRFMHTGTKYNH